MDFEAELKQNLNQLQVELLSQNYKPKPLETFILRDPKTRKISKSDFRDRVVHHAICNIIEPLFDKTFIHDSFANRRGKGTLNTIKRFDYFKRKVSRNNNKTCYVLKADVRHYFDTVDYNILLKILSEKIECKNTLWLIRIILKNHKTTIKGKGMPLGNLTSQFLANVYLDKLDQFVKHELKAKHYIRYVDDFVIMHTNKSLLEEWKVSIDIFLKKELDLELHPDKSKVIPLNKGIGFLGFRIFYYHKLVRKKNLNRFQKRIKDFSKLYKEGKVERENVVESLEGWFAYIQHANTYKYRKGMLASFNKNFPIEQVNIIKNIRRHESFKKKIIQSKMQFSSQKTLLLLKKRMTIKEIANKRGVKEGTVWEHLAKLIEYRQLNVNKVLPKEKISVIRKSISSVSEPLKTVKSRLDDDEVSYDEIACVMASIKARRSSNTALELVR